MPSLDGPQALGALLLTLYGAARNGGLVDDFRLAALHALQAYVPFDGAHWALLAGHELYGSCLIGLPADSNRIINAADRDHSVSRWSRSHPGETLRFGPEDLRDTAQGRCLADALDVRHLLATTAAVSQPSQLCHSLNLVRRGDSPPFSADEQAFVQCLSPHLTLLLRINEFLALERTRHGDTDARSAMAVADTRGMLHAVEPAFEQWLVREWPGWSGPRLPAPLCEAFLCGDTPYAGQRIAATVRRRQDRWLVTVADRSPLDLLTPRERTVALAYAQGRSHKEVARDLGLSPVTVRGYLRQVYDKLGVDDKAKLARMVAGGSVTPPASRT